MYGWKRYLKNVEICHLLLGLLLVWIIITVLYFFAGWCCVWSSSLLLLFRPLCERTCSVKGIDRIHKRGFFFHLFFEKKVICQPTISPSFQEDSAAFLDFVASERVTWKNEIETKLYFVSHAAKSKNAVESRRKMAMWQLKLFLLFLLFCLNKSVCRQ